MRVLLVGAGAVGLTYGRHLQLGGAQVAFYVKPHYAASLRGGVDMYPLNKGRMCAPERFDGFEVLTTPQEVAASGPWDALWLCVSSPALRGGWVGELVRAVGYDATVVGLQPGNGDRDVVLSVCPEERLVWGLITLIAYQSPLPGEHRGPGIAYWFPPLTPNPFDGPSERAAAMAGALSRGGCPAAVRSGVVALGSLGGAGFMAFIAALEGAGWSLERLRQSEWAALGSAAAREAISVMAWECGLGSQPDWLAWVLLRPSLLNVVIQAAPWVVPIPLEVYLAYHFTKVGDQTRQIVNSTIALGLRQGRPMHAMSALYHHALGDGGAAPQQLT